MLPKIKFPTFEVEIPSTKNKARVRPMLVRDEKILLTAKEGKAVNETFIAVRNVVQNCMISGDEIIINKLTPFDIEYLFLKIRSVSVGNVVDLVFTDSEDDDKKHDFKINLDDVKVKFSNGKDTSPFNIKMSGDSGIIMKYPASSVYESKAFTSEDATPEELLDDMVMACLEKFYDGEKMVKFRDCPPDEIKEFINNMDVKTYGKIRDFISDLPTLHHEVKYKNSKGEEKTLTLSSLMDFFAFA